MSQILEEDPNKENQYNSRLMRPISGGHRRQCLMPKSPSSLFQKPEILSTHTHSHASFDRTSHEQPYKQT